MNTAIVLTYSVLPTFFLFALSALEKRANTPSPLQVVGWTFLLGYSLKGIYLAFSLVTGAPHRLEYFGEETIFVGVTATLVGVSSFIVGYALTPSVKLRTGRSFIISSPIISKLAYNGLLILSVVLMLIFFWRMGFFNQIISLQFTAKKYLELQGGEYATSLGFLTIGGDFILVFALYYIVFGNSHFNRNVYIIFLSFLFLTYFLASRRNAVIIMLVAFLLVSGINRTSKKFSTWLRRIGAFFLAVIILGLLSFSSQIRQGGGEKSLSGLSLSAALETTTRHFLEGAYFMDPSKTGAVMLEVRDRDLWQLGESYYTLVIAPIPRVLWQDKPAVRNSYFVGDDLLDLRNRSGAPPSGIAELYMNFGWIGVVAGMMFIGAIVRLIYISYLTSSDKRFARVPFALSLLCLSLFFLADFGMAALFFIRYAIAIFVCNSYWHHYCEKNH